MVVVVVRVEGLQIHVTRLPSLNLHVPSKQQQGHFTSCGWTILKDLSTVTQNKRSKLSSVSFHVQFLVPQTDMHPRASSTPTPPTVLFIGAMAVVFSHLLVTKDQSLNFVDLAFMGWLLGAYRICSGFARYQYPNQFLL